MRKTGDVLNMTTCIKCGAPIEDGELFCANCAQNGAAVQPRPAPLPAGRMQTPPRLKKQPAEPVSAAKKTCRFAFDGHSCNLLHPASGCWRIFVSDRQRKAAQSAGGTRPAAGGNIVFDQYAVCVNVGSEVYHRYGCTLFKPENFEILNEKLAEAEGYLSCPVCIGQ